MESGATIRQTAAPTPFAAPLTKLEGLWRRDRQLAPLDGVLNEVQVVSCDIFDTLLFRTCAEPEDVFEWTGERALAAGLLAHGMTGPQFRLLRREAMRRAYAESVSEPTLEEIYQRMPPALVNREAVANIEREVEAELCFLNPSVASFLLEARRRGLHIALVSDMYLGRKTVRDLLETSGFDLSMVDVILVSVDEHAFKASGELYDRLRSHFTQVPAHSILHVGDNSSSDVTEAERKGLRAQLYSGATFDPHSFVQWESLQHGSILSGLRSLRSLVQQLAGPGDSEDSVHDRIGGAVFGPFFTLFAEWAVDLAEREQADVIAPLMREAVTLGPLLRRAVEARGLNLPVAPLYVSREALFLASRNGLGPEDLESFFERPGFRLGDLFRCLRVESPPPHLASFSDELLVEARQVEIPGHGNLREAVWDWLTSVPVQQHLQEESARRRAQFSLYLRETLGDSRRVFTVDVGFYGHIQEAIDRIFHLQGRSSPFVHCLAFTRENLGDLLCNGIRLHSFCEPDTRGETRVATIHRSAPVLEQCLMGREGSTVGYAISPDGHGVVPHTLPNPIPEKELAWKEHVQRGIRCFQELWICAQSTKRSAGGAWRPDRQQLLLSLYRLIDFPTPEEAHALGRLHNDTNFGSSEVVPLCPEEIIEQARRVRAVDFVQKYLRSCPAVWPQGCLTLADPTGLFQLRGSSDRTEHLSLAFTILCRLRESKQHRFGVFGAGDIGRRFLRSAHLAGLPVACYVDSNRRLWGTTIDGIRVVPLDEALALNVNCFLIASVAFEGDIRALLLDRLASRPQGGSIFNLKGEEEHVPGKVMKPLQREVNS